jgi:hypothetical protein
MIATSLSAGYGGPPEPWRRRKTKMPAKNSGADRSFVIVASFAIFVRGSVTRL